MFFYGTNLHFLVGEQIFMNVSPASTFHPRIQLMIGFLHLIQMQLGKIQWVSNMWSYAQEPFVPFILSPPPSLFQTSLHVPLTLLSADGLAENLRASGQKLPQLPNRPPPAFPLKPSCTHRPLFLPPSLHSQKDSPSLVSGKFFHVSTPHPLPPKSSFHFLSWLLHSF